MSQTAMDITVDNGDQSVNKTIRDPEPLRPTHILNEGEDSLYSDENQTISEDVDMRPEAATTIEAKQQASVNKIVQDVLLSEGRATNGLEEWCQPSEDSFEDSEQWVCAEDNSTKLSSTQTVYNATNAEVAEIECGDKNNASHDDEPIQSLRSHSNQNIFESRNGIRDHILNHESWVGLNIAEDLSSQVDNELQDDRMPSEKNSDTTCMPFGDNYVVQRSVQEEDCVSSESACKHLESFSNSDEGDNESVQSGYDVTSIESEQYDAHLIHRGSGTQCFERIHRAELPATHDADKDAKFVKLPEMISKESLSRASKISNLSNSDNSSESLVKPTRKSTTSIKNIIDAFECQPLRDSFHGKPTRNKDADKIGSIEDYITQIDATNSETTPSLRPTRETLNNMCVATHNTLKSEPNETMPVPNKLATSVEKKVFPTTATLETGGSNDQKGTLNPLASATGVPDGMLTDLVYWRDAKKTGVVFGVLLGVLSVLRTCSIISIVAWSGLTLISAGCLQRVFSQTKVRQRRSNKLDDFMKAFSDQNVRENTDRMVIFIDLWFTRLRKIFLVDNIANTLQVALLCYTLTYVGAWFNGVTVATILLAGVFSGPKLYDSNKSRIQEAVAEMGSKWNRLAAKAKMADEAGRQKLDIQELF